MGVLFKCSISMLKRMDENRYWMDAYRKKVQVAPKTWTELAWLLNTNEEVPKSAAIQKENKVSIRYVTRTVLFLRY